MARKRKKNLKQNMRPRFGRTRAERAVRGRAMQRGYKTCPDGTVIDAAMRCAPEHCSGPVFNARPYGPGKFDTMLDAAVYQLSLDESDEEAGSVSEVGMWAGLMYNGEILSQGLELAKDLDTTREERAYLAKEGQAGVILTENDQGFVNVSYFKKKKDLEDEWKAIVEDLAVYEENPRQNPATAAAKRRCMR
jgi:hypothetical protein